jgi:hypothetical protein
MWRWCNKEKEWDATDVGDAAVHPEDWDPHGVCGTESTVA